MRQHHRQLKDRDVVTPNFLIAGAGKAGTTSLHDYLGQHPDIFMSSFKEPNYFVPGNGYENWDDYLSLFHGAHHEKAIGESSTGYLYCEQSPTWIESVLFESSNNCLTVTCRSVSNKNRAL